MNKKIPVYKKFINRYIHFVRKEKSTDIPSWTKGKQKEEGEADKDAAKKLMDEKYGEGNWMGDSNSEYNKKYFDRRDK